MDIKKEYERWLANATADADVVAELKTLDDAKIEDAFYRDLAFGTGGLRGVIGAGTNRMNVYTVAKASQGLADYLKKNFETPSVAIGYDSRIKSNVFAKVAAGVFAANGVKVNIWPVLMPVPTVSFATRYLHTSAGVMVTASHNPSKYNGYKVYGADGCQITTEAAAEILAEIEKLDIFADVKTSDFEAGVANGSILDDPVLLKFMAAGYHFPVGYAIINSTKHYGEGPTWSNDAFVHTVCRSWKRGRSSVPIAAENLQGATRRAVFRQALCWQAGILWATSRAWTARASSTGAWRTTALSG